MKTVSDLINRLVVKRFFIVMMSGMICSLSAWADISTTSQQLDDFSFKKGLTAHGGLTFSNEFYSGSDSLVRRDPYAYFLNGNLNMNLWGISMPFSFSYSNTQISYTILYCGTHGLMADIRVDQVIEFQGLFLDRMRASHSKILEELGAGIVSDGAGAAIERVAADICRHLGK